MSSDRSGTLISIVVPVYNEEKNIRRAYEAITGVFQSLSPAYAFEIIFTDNHSTDTSFDIIRAISRSDPRVRGVRFTRNFGFHRSILTGYRLAQGAAAIQIDCDLQDPPEMIPAFLDEWKKGHDVVAGVRRERQDSQSYQWARGFYYRMLANLSDDTIVLDSGDFRLLDRTILDQLKKINDAAPFVRGLTSLLASNQAVVPYDRKPRQTGESKFPLRRLLNLAVDGVLAHSTAPLRLAAYTGLVIAILTFLLTAFYVIGRLVFGMAMPAGFATTTVLLLLGISLNAIFLGVIGEYVGRIYNQVRTRPITVIEDVVNLSAPNQPNLKADQR